MDERGYWHNADDPRRNDLRDKFTCGEVRRFVIELGPGDLVGILRRNGDAVAVKFESAERNRVTFRRIDHVGPYFEFGEPVQIKKGEQIIEAQVWDNRDGKLILRTLPVNP